MLRCNGEHSSSCPQGLYILVDSILIQELAIFCYKGQIVNTLGFSGHIWFMLLIHLYFFLNFYNILIV